MDKPFESDGCTVVADFDQNECCLRHDWLYWQGGTPEQRKQADDQFYECIRTTQSAWLAAFRWFGVRIGGLAFVPAPTARWGYGWKWPKSKAPADDDSPYTADNQREVYDRLLEKARARDQAWRDAHPK